MSVIDGRGWGSSSSSSDNTGRWWSHRSSTLGVGAIVIVGQRWWGVGRCWPWWGGHRIGRHRLTMLEGGGWDDGGGGGGGVVMSLSLSPPSDNIGGGVVVALFVVIV